MRFDNEADAITYIFRSMRKLRDKPRGLDEISRDTKPTQWLLAAHHLLETKREYVVVTGSKGKGSITAITAKLLQHLGHRVGMMTSPHLVSWYERIRIDGRTIPPDDLFRILSDLAPEIDRIEDTLSGDRYISPQGIFLAIALQWFDEQGVDVAVLEVGRGGRYDDIAVVPNELSLFGPIIVEHAQYLGETLDRIAWHKAGIIKPYSTAYSLPQDPLVMEVLQREADAKDAAFNWIAPADMGEYIGETEKGLRMRLGRYGEVEVSLHGRYQVANATLAVIGAGNVHSRLEGIPHTSPEYVARIRAGLADVKWPGRLQKLQDTPAIYIDGAINPTSAQAFLDSMINNLYAPVSIILGVPRDRDYAAVYRVFAPHARQLILTESDANPNIHFPNAETALATARQVHDNVEYAPHLSEALEKAKAFVGERGTVLLSVAQPLVGEAMMLWRQDTEQI
ncbi:MAG: hypothetical protein D6737_17240 [Chloroflexi bacterium]|nr:MAG: hypothetical protein D6737_17240 [Chloroflexota bacterium]